RQGGDRGVRVGEPALRVPRAGDLEPVVEHPGYGCAIRGWHGGPALDDPAEQLRYALVVVRSAPGEALVSDDAERPDVGGGAELACVLHLLWGHVVRRADGGVAHAAQRIEPGSGGGRRSGAGELELSEDLGDAEVDHLDLLGALLIGEDDDVLRLEIAV